MSKNVHASLRHDQSTAGNYISMIKCWLATMFPIPQKVIIISLIFFILALPVVTIGYAGLVCTIMARFTTDGREVSLRRILKLEASKSSRKAILMGLMDLFAMALCFLSIGILFGPETTPIMRFLYSFFLLLDIIFLASSVFRFPMMAANPSLNLREILLRSMVAMFRHLPAQFLYMMVLLSLLILCVLTGIGILLVFPGATVFLTVIIYRKTLTQENLEDQ